jgi:hypothetical protein
MIKEEIIMTYGNSTLIKCLCTINDYIIEEGLDLSTYADTLEKKKYPEDMVNDVRIAIDNIKESLRETYLEIKPINPDEELQLSVNDAIEGIDRYIENGGYKL